MTDPQSNPSTRKKKSYNLKTITREPNEAFTLYYQGNIINQDEWEQFIDIMKKDLNTSFRISPTAQLSGYLGEMMKVLRDELGDIEYDGVVYGPPQEIEWCV